jgi:hypothetical protein
MMRLFEKARWFYRSGGQAETKAYGNTVALQVSGGYDAVNQPLYSKLT